MKNILLMLTITLSLSASSQNTFPHSAMLKDTSGNMVDSKTFANKGKPLVIDFWATWCKPCIVKFNSMKDVYKKWQEETGVRIIAVSIDTKESFERAKAMAAKNGWPFDLVFDEDSKFLSQLTDETAIPHSFFYDKDLKLVTEKTGVNISKKGNKEDIKAVQEFMSNKTANIADFESNIDDYYKIIKKIAGAASKGN